MPASRTSTTAARSPGGTTRCPASRTPTSVPREAGDVSPAELTSPDQVKRVPARLWQAAQHGYESGRVGIGVLSALLDEEAEDLFARLASEGVRPPIMHDDLADL